VDVVQATCQCLELLSQSRLVVDLSDEGVIKALPASACRVVLGSR
jgi:hypothetical protein